jgi:uncharacterized protein (TIRG00374 family)
VNEFRVKLAQGFAILHDRRAFLTGVVTWQAASWLARGAAVYFFLEAFHIPASVQATVTVLVVQGLSTLLPFTPGGAGTQQAVLVFAFSGTAAASTVLGFSVGMQLVTTAVNVLLGFGAIAIMLRTLRWRQHVFADEELKAETSPEPPGTDPAAPPSRSALPGRANGV